ncbi:MAG: GNAT family N-acetyltransferase [Myxococcales bacterium]|nr:GNAT family N-acetyltransferase [Myxococcales bacterium]
MSDEERTPPTRIRVTGLQEAQIQDLERFGYDAANEAVLVGIERPPRRGAEIARLARTHDVVVAEADHDPAGYLAWRDEEPGVAVLDTLLVGTEYRRFGIGTRLARELGEHARKAGIEDCVAWVHPKATWAAAFLTVLGFAPLASVKSAPSAKLERWRELHAAEIAAGPDQLWWRHTARLGVTELPGVPLPPDDD